MPAGRLTKPGRRTNPPQNNSRHSEEHQPRRWRTDASERVISQGSGNATFQARHLPNARLRTSWLGVQRGRACLSAEVARNQASARLARQRNFSTSIRLLPAPSYFEKMSHRLSGDTDKPHARSPSIFATISTFRVAKLKRWSEDLSQLEKK